MLTIGEDLAKVGVCPTVYYAALVMSEHRSSHSEERRGICFCEKEHKEQIPLPHAGSECQAQRTFMFIGGMRAHVALGMTCHPERSEGSAFRAGADLEVCAQPVIPFADLKACANPYCGVPEYDSGP